MAEPKLVAADVRRRIPVRNIVIIRLLTAAATELQGTIPAGDPQRLKANGRPGSSPRNSDETSTACRPLDAARGRHQFLPYERIVVSPPARISSSIYQFRSPRGTA